MVWMGRLVDWHGGGEGGKGTEGAGAVAVLGADEVGSMGVVDGSEPSGGDGDGVGSAESDEGSHGLAAAEFGRFVSFMSHLTLLHSRVLERQRPDNCDIFCDIFRLCSQAYTIMAGGCQQLRKISQKISQACEI